MGHEVAWPGGLAASPTVPHVTFQTGADVSGLASSDASSFSQPAHKCLRRLRAIGGVRLAKKNPENEVRSRLERSLLNVLYPGKCQRED